jgi:hypothetical protein
MTARGNLGRYATDSITTCEPVDVARCTIAMGEWMCAFASHVNWSEADHSQTQEVSVQRIPSQVEGAALGIALLRTLAAGGAGGAALTFATTHHRCCSRHADSC